ncbi:Aminopeptidase S [Enhygromyxa salina]|uniref:Aminopeptidase S n=1 Tax=Enhygromyxa salina TaxID=215803 RepID=A0A2S9Y112_9BACT|nr:M28 family peptidase [Enhygromyxa salina]PRP98795.1 Aminopeptidase S [Enhygromyxa salina]
MFRACVYVPGLAALVLALPACGDDGPAAETSAATESSAPTSDSGATDDAETGETGESSCPADSPRALGECVERERYLADLEFIAQPREPGSPHWQAVQDLCAQRFAEYGFEVDLHTYATGVNVVGRKLGSSQPNEQIVVAAHYDHLVGCEGADDNASGTAGVLEAARVLSQAEFPRTLIVACWDEEEDGLLGAEAYVDAATSNGGQILFNWNFEMIGYRDDAPDSQTVPDGFELLFPDQVQELEANQYRGDFVAVVVDEAGVPEVEPFMTYAAGFGLSAVLLPVPADLKNSPLLADLRRSDHAAFWEVDIPAVMLTDTSNFRYANYHCQTGEDAVELLDHDFATSVLATTVAATAESLGMTP